jgi:CBS domain-containing protein
MICPHCGFDNLPGSEQCDNCQADMTQLDRPVAQDRVEWSLMEETVAHLQPRRAITLPPTATVRQAIEVMLANDTGAVLVVNDRGSLAGIFSERDLLTRVAVPDQDHMNEPLSRFMTASPETVRPTDTLAFVLHKMDCGGYRHLPVLKDGQPLGMISVRDMLRHITRLCKSRGH